MSILFFIKILWSFMAGGLMVVGVTLLAERLSPRVAGVVSALPTTIIGGLIFIALSADIPTATAALAIAPVMIVAVMMFVLGFVICCPRSMGAGLLGGTMLWWATTFLALSLPKNIWLQVGCFMVVYGLVALSVGRIPLRAAPQVSVTRCELTCRALVAGSAMSAVVAAVKFGGPLWGGVFACGFPAVISCTLCIMNRRHGPHFARTLARSMPHGSAGACAFALSCYVIATANPTWPGLVFGIVIGFGLALVVSSLASTFFHKIHAHPLYLKLQPK